MVEMGMTTGVRAALDGLLSHYLTSLDTTTCKESSAIDISEDVLSIMSDWVVGVQRRRNRATPIFRLPNEVLLILFRFCVPPDRFQLPENEEMVKSGYWPITKDYYVDLLKLCGVAFDWARLVRNTRNFWVYTRSTDRQELTDLIFERSRTSLLWGGSSFTHLGPASPYALAPDVKELGAATFPKLSQLLVVGAGCSFAPLPYFFKCKRPRLKYLQVVGVGLDWDQWPPHPKLNDLRLCNRPGARELKISYSQLCNTTERCLSLQAFQIDSVYITDLPQDQTTTLPSSSMPVLDFLEFTRVEPAQSIPLLLSHVALDIDATVLTTVRFRGKRSVLEIEDACLIIGSLSQRISSLTRPTMTLCIATSRRREGKFQIQCWDDRIDTTISDGPEGGSRIRQLVQSLDPKLRTRITLLSLSLQSPMKGMAHYLNDHLSNVEELVIVEPDVPTLDDLCSPSDTPTAEWLFPQMRKLRLYFGYGNPGGVVTHAHPAIFTSLCKVAKARSAQAGSLAVGNTIGLGCLRLEGSCKIQRRDVEVLKALVPEVAIDERLEIVEESPRFELVDE